MPTIRYSNARGNMFWTLPNFSFCTSNSSLPLNSNSTSSFFPSSLLPFPALLHLLSCLIQTQRLCFASLQSPTLNSVFMKSSSSSSSPSSSPYIYSQRSRCIFSMLRRILCLPTRDHTSSSSSAAKDDDSIVTTMMMMKEEENAVPGGLVARLMGLDSMPDKITRSRSLNSVPDKITRSRRSPKRTRSKSSTYIELLDIEDDKFIVLSFHNRPHNDMRSNRDKIISARNYDAEAVKKQENSSSKKQIRLVKKKKKKTENSSSDSDESSPISVFDFQQSQTYQETATPTSDDDSWTRSSNSSRVSIYSSPEQDNTNISIDQQKPPPALLNKKTKAVVVVVNGQKKNREMWDRVCDITVAEINKGTADWVDNDLAAEFEVHIMDQLFNELLLH